LDELERANLFIIPLDNKRHWYRYHHLFADLLRQRLHQGTASSTGDEGRSVAELRIRASIWYEDNGLEIEAFHHATAANDIERAERLMEGDWMPLPFRGAVTPVLNWLKSLPPTVLDARPLLWVTYASTLLATGQRTGVEEKLQAAEAALQDAESYDKTQDVVGRIAATRATLAVGQYQVETTIAQSRRALEFLHPDNLAFRTSTTWKLGYAYQLQGNRAAASQAYTEAMSIGQASGNIIFTVSAAIGLGSLQQAENQLYLAAETYRHALQLFGDQPLPSIACEAHLGLAFIFYEWNDMDAAQQYGQQSYQMMQQLETSDRLAACEVFLARLKLAQGDVAGAAAILDKAGQFVRQHNFVFRIPEVVTAQVFTLLHQGNLTAAADLAEKHKLPISQARVHLAQGDTSAALAVLGPLRRHVEAKGWEDERLKVMVLQAVALHAHGEKDKAAQLLGDALALAEPGGFIRIFVDEGSPIAELLEKILDDNIDVPRAYVKKLLSAFRLSKLIKTDDGLGEHLSERELEVLGLIAGGLSNKKIMEELFLSLSTVKTHIRNIYSKLNVHSRTEVIVKSKEMDLL
jgi:LuxR family maltose regulon positive regulatory protein